MVEAANRIGNIKRCRLLSCPLEYSDHVRFIEIVS
jgi:hypothetical protein